MKIPSENEICVIWSQIKSFQHNLFLTFNIKTSFTKVFTFDQLNMKIISENWNVFSFGHKLSNLSQPVHDLRSKNILWKMFSIGSTKWEYADIKIKWVFIWSQLKSFHHNLLLTSNLKTYVSKVSTFYQLNMKMISNHNLFLTSDNKTFFYKSVFISKLKLKMPFEK